MCGATSHESITRPVVRLGVHHIEKKKLGQDVSYPKHQPCHAYMRTTRFFDVKGSEWRPEP